MKDDGKKIALDLLGVESRVDASFEVEPIHIMDKRERRLCSKVTSFVKVQWSALMSWM